MPRVSVIVATYNSSGTLRCTLESIVDQTFRDFEVWVVGDGCTDDSGQVVSALDDARFRWINLDRNYGSQCWPNNEGLRRASGEYVAYLGHDDLWFPWHLSNLIGVMKRANAQFAYGVAMVLGRDGKTGKAGAHAGGKTHLMHLSPPSGWMHRRDITDRIGFWRDPDDLLYQTDSDFQIRAYGAHLSFAAADELSVIKFPSVEWGLVTLREGPPQQQYLARMKSDPEVLRSSLLEAAVEDAVPPPGRMQPLRTALRPILDLIGRERWPLRSFYLWRNRRERERRRKLRGMPHADGSMTLPPPPAGSGKAGGATPGLSIPAGLSNAYAAARRHLRPVKRAARRVYVSIFGEMTDYLSGCKGIIHVGANEGQERELYARHRLRVVWIEANPAVYRRLLENIAGLSEQMAINALITDREGEQRVFHVAGGSGVASSIFDLHQHLEIWPDHRYEHDLELKTSTLPKALAAAGVDTAGYDALRLDTQGSELLVLTGSASILPLFRYIQTEAADFESYRGGATVQQIVEFMTRHGFRLVKKQPFAHRPGGGTCYELLFRDGRPRPG